MTNNYLFTGAGYSCNWGYPSGKEIQDIIYGHKLIRNNKEIRKLLNNLESKQNYEDLLELASRDTNLKDIIDEVIFEVFVNMEKDTDAVIINATGGNSYMMHGFCEHILPRMDIFFTLNQDDFIEKEIIFSNTNFKNFNKKIERPGIIRTGEKVYLLNRTTKDMIDDKFLMKDFHFNTEIVLPYIKLHGGSNLYDSYNRRVMISGRKKRSEIDEKFLLTEYNKFFQERISISKSRLMLIGYGFGDDHINETISNACKNYGLKIFIWDISGRETFDHQMKKKEMKLDIGDDSIIGICSSSLSDIFNLHNKFRLNTIIEQFFET